MATYPPDDDLEAWKEAHRHLTLAVVMTKDAIVAEKAKRRYLLEEIYTNVTIEGTLAPTSKWALSSAAKTNASTKQKSSKQKQATVKKGRKKKSVENTDVGSGGGGGVKLRKEKSKKKKMSVGSVSGGDSAAPPAKKRIKISIKKQRASKKKEQPKAIEENDYQDSSLYPNPYTRGSDEQSRHQQHHQQQQQHYEQTEDPPMFDHSSRGFEYAEESYGDQMEVGGVEEVEEEVASMVNPFQTSLNATAAALLMASQVAATAMANYQYVPPPPDPDDEELMEESASAQLPPSDHLNHGVVFSNVGEEMDVSADVDDHADTDSNFINNSDPNLMHRSGIIDHQGGFEAELSSNHDPNSFSVGASDSLFQQMLQQQDEEDEEDDF